MIYSYTTLTSNTSFSLEEDRGYAEIFQYLKEYWIALLLGFLAVKKRSFLYFSWSALFFYLFLDDSAQLHEKLGYLVSKNLPFSAVANLPGQDLGELAVSAAVGLFFLILIGIAYRFGDRFSRKASKYLIMLLFVLAFFGIAVDMIHAITVNSPSLYSFLSMVEDGGELVIMSVIACFVFLLSESLQSDTAKLKNLEREFPVELAGRK